MEKWKIIVEPQGRDLNSPTNAVNDGGLVFYLFRPAGGIPYTSEVKQEVNRVAFDRARSANPRSSFGEMVTKVKDTAVHACKLLNEDMMGDGTLQ